MKKVFLSVMACLVLLVSCGTTGVFTTRDHLIFGASYTPLPASEVPAVVQAYFPEEEVVVADRDALRQDAEYIPIDGSEETKMDWMDTAFNIAKVFIPSLTAYEGVLAMFSRRKRKNWATAFAAMTPKKGRFQPKQALDSIAAVIGSSHSTVTSKEVAEKDWEKQTVVQ